MIRKIFRKIRALSLLLAVGLACSGVHLRADWTTGATFSAGDIESARNTLKPFGDILSGPPHEPSPGWKSYLAFYGLDTLPGDWRAGYVTVPGGAKVFAQVFSPRDAVGTVVFVHGYLKHSAYARDIAAFFVRKGYRAVLMDLPGHGFSDGERGVITDFSDYSDALRAVLDAVKDGGPLYVAGHSTGGATAIDLVERGLAGDVAAIALFAPLVHNVLWGLSRFALTTTGWFLPYVFRIEYVQNRTADWDRLENKLDPLVPRRVPTSWGRSLGAWNRRLLASTPQPWNGSLLIVQGDKDRVVDGAWNVPFLLKRYPRVRVLMVPGATHDLWEEPAPYGPPGFEAALELFSRQADAGAPL
ncbi:MAG: alpha/beta hydrolase [Spirochaetes bacterium]|nr:alpha/beta hydrolase [Spirochaetota bacterium]